MDRRWCACPGVESQFQQVFSSKSHNTMLRPVKPYHKVCPESLPCNAGSSDDDTFYDRTTKAKPGAGGGAKKGKAGGGAKQEVGGVGGTVVWWRTCRCWMLPRCALTQRPLLRHCLILFCVPPCSWELAACGERRPCGRRPRGCNAPNARFALDPDV